MPVPSLPLLEVLYTVVVFIAVMAVLTRTYAEVAVGAAILALLWELVIHFGVTLWIAILCILLAGVLRVWVGGVVADRGRMFGTQTVAGFLDDLLRQDQAPNRDQRAQRPSRADPEWIDTDVTSIDDYRR